MKNDGSFSTDRELRVTTRKALRVARGLFHCSARKHTESGDLLKQRRMLSKFCSETDTVRDETMKIIPKIVEGPWVAKHALGSKPALLGRAVTQNTILVRGGSRWTLTFLRPRPRRVFCGS